MARITVTQRHQLSFEVNVRGYRVVSSEPVTAGGTGEGPTPTELIVAGLAACAADVATRQLMRAGLAHWPLEVDADFAWDRAGERIEDVVLTLALPGPVEASTRAAVVDAIAAGPGWRLLAEPPTVECEAAATPARVPVPAGYPEWPSEPPPDVDSEDS